MPRRRSAAGAASSIVRRACCLFSGVHASCTGLRRVGGGAGLLGGGWAGGWTGARRGAGVSGGRSGEGSTLPGTRVAGRLGPRPGLRGTRLEAADAGRRPGGPTDAARGPGGFGPRVAWSPRSAVFVGSAGAVALVVLGLHADGGCRVGGRSRVESAASVSGRERCPVSRQRGLGSGARMPLRGSRTLPSRSPRPRRA